MKKIIAQVAGVIVATVFAMWLLVFATIYLATISGWWVLGGKVTIKKDDKPIGYLRWFKYTRTV